MDRHFAILLCPLILTTACGASGERSTARLLNDRLQTQMAPDIAANRASVQPLSAGTRVVLLGPSQFPNDKDILDGRIYDVRASIIEGLLDPDLMRVQVSDTSDLPDRQRRARVDNVVQYFVDNGLGPTLTPTEPLQAAQAAAPVGLTVTISVQCPKHDEVAGYGSGQRSPDCD